MRLNESVFVGAKFGCLEIIAIFQKRRFSCGKYRNFRWITLKCECGKVFDRNVQTFLGIKRKAGYPESCLCSKKPGSDVVFSKPRKPIYDKWHILTTNKVSDARRNAAQKGWEYSLTDAEVLKLVTSPCHYCQHPGRNCLKYNKGMYEVWHNGIDRLNNDLGYISQNVVPCCHFCNYAKGTNSIEDFKAWISRITTHNRKLTLAEFTKAITSPYKDLYSRSKSKAKTRNKPWLLSFEEFYKLVLANCYYCGIQPQNVYTNKTRYAETLTYSGLDRKDNNIGYCFENCLPCCWNCNRARNKNLYEEFLIYLNELKVNYGRKS